MRSTLAIGLVALATAFLLMTLALAATGRLRKPVPVAAGLVLLWGGAFALLAD